MNDGHRRRLAEVLGQVDEWLGRIADLLDVPDPPPPYARYRQSLPPPRRAAVAAAVVQARASLRAVTDDLGLVPPPPATTLQAARSRAAVALVALADLAPPRLTGYGPLTDADAAGCARPRPRWRRP